MKLLFLIGVSIFFTSCFESGLVTVNPSDLKFKAGDHVITTVAFYANCEGTIEDFNGIRPKNSPPSYKISFYCPNIGRLGIFVEILETKLAFKKDGK